MCLMNQNRFMTKHHLCEYENTHIQKKPKCFAKEKYV